MPGGTAARAYARALMDLALANEGLERWERDLGRVKTFFERASAPGQSSDDKLRHFRDALTDAAPLVRNFVGVMLERNQSHLFENIRQEFGRLADAHRGVARAEVVTAVPLDAERRRRLTEGLSELTGKKVTVTEKVDAAVVGGFVARVGDRLIDGSTKARLRDLRDSLALRPA